jgi:NADP-dependent aldehyde dehydrogenase
MSNPRDVLIDGEWRPADATGTFEAVNPSTGETIGDPYPVSSRADVDAALSAAAEAAEELLDADGEDLARFLEDFADRIEHRAEKITALAARETALPLSPRLADVELPRTTDQMRQAARAARDSSWKLPTIDTKLGIRSSFGSLAAPVAVFGPNNFPLAFNSISGGDFVAAIAAGNPVIAKANTGHPGTTRLLAEEASTAVKETGLPRATVQLLYRTGHPDGDYMVSHPLIGATAYTGSRSAGLALKAAADQAGKPIYLELSSVNPVFVLPGALRERSGDIASEFLTSVFSGTGQFCTNPGIVVLLEGDVTERFVDDVKERFRSTPPGVLLGRRVAIGLAESVQALLTDGAELLVGGSAVEGDAMCFENTLLRVSGEKFLANPPALQREAFGNSSLLVVADSVDQLVEIAGSFEGNLSGCVYSAAGGADEDLYGRIVRSLRRRVGRLLNDKMPTGVAVSPAMNHGGPYPATGHPGFTAVGVPAALRRFGLLQCYDNVREARLPPELRDKNPTGKLWRSIDGEWSTADVG